MKRFISFLLVAVIILATPAYAREIDIDYGNLVVNPLFKAILKEYNGGDNGLPILPDEHPYLLLTPDYIERIKSLKDSEDYGPAYKYMISLANKELPVLENKNLSTVISRQIEARAFAYAMGEVDKAHAKETVRYTIEYLTNCTSAQTDSIAKYKDFGTQGMQVGAFVYDWCYSAMSESEKATLAERVKTLMYDKVQQARPDNVDQWNDIAGKSVGEPIIYNSAVAIAFYDIYPEIYNTIMPKILGPMAEILKTYSANGCLTDAGFAYSRESYAYHVAIMFQRLGYDIYGDQTKLGYKMIYSRTPHGAMVRQGDDHSHENYVIGTHSTHRETIAMGLLGTLSEDPYIWYQYAKEYAGKKDLSTLLYFINDAESKLPDDLPLANFVEEPRSEIIARTSWKMGLDAPAAMAYMNMNNRRTGDHDHADIGSFQIYYKGALTMPGGIYYGGDWGKGHWNSYYSRSVASNCILVKDPDEVFTFGKTVAQSNDGGQEMVSNSQGGYVIGSIAENLAESNYRTKTEAYYIGPNNMTPAFSYIKGDITKAYSAKKMGKYQRSMVFMDLFDETYPAAFVVFDRVVSNNASFKKTWLLQSCTEPQIENNKITIVNTIEGSNGKLVNYTLYPENPKITAVGGEGMEFSVDGVHYEPSKRSTGSPSYMGGWRSEVSPATSNKEDIFLNAMYVTDADGNAVELPMHREDTDIFVGVTVKDRSVYFSKNAELISKPFSIDIRDNGFDKVMCLVTDIAEGKWKISGNGESFVLQSNNRENTLMFTGKPGKYTITPADESAEVQSFEYKEMPKEQTGDFSLKIGQSYIYNKYPNILKDGVPYVEAQYFLENNRGAETSLSGDKLTIKLADMEFVLTAGQTKYEYKKGGAGIGGNLMYPPFIDENGRFYINFESIASKLGLTVRYSKSGKVLTLSLAQLQGGTSSSADFKDLDETRVLQPTAIYASSDDGNVPENTIDRNLATRWSSYQGDGEWLCFDLGEEKDVSAVMISFYNGDKRNWKFDIQVSNDDINYTTVLPAQQSAGKSLGLEEFKMPAGTKARYVRYVGHGEVVTKSLYNSLTQFVIIK